MESGEANNDVFSGVSSTTRTMASAAELLHQAFRVRGYSVDHPSSADFQLHFSSRRFRRQPHVASHCDVPLMLLAPNSRRVFPQVWLPAR